MRIKPPLSWTTMIIVLFVIAAIFLAVRLL
jgi:hypothetical protein